jgi:hypothetical protein
VRIHDEDGNVHQDFGSALGREGPSFQEQKERPTTEELEDPDVSAMYNPNLTETREVVPKIQAAVVERRQEGTSAVA